MSEPAANACLSLMAGCWWLGAEAAMVVPLRLARLAGGGEAAAREAKLMVEEKVDAHRGLVAAWQSGDLGKGAAQLADGAVQHYLGYVRANRKRLLRGD